MGMNSVLAKGGRRLQNGRHLRGQHLNGGRHLFGGPPPEAAGFGRRFVVATSFGSVLNPVNSSIIAVALVAIGHAFGAGAATTTWLVSALYLATAIGQPTAGRLADMIGPRRVYLAGTALVGAGGLLGFAGWSIGSLVAARVIIGLGTSAAYPAAMAMVRGQSRRLRRDAPGSVLGALAIAAQVTMAIGPPLGGLLIAIGGWRLTFIINVPLAIAGMIAIVAWLPADSGREQAAARRELDFAGLFLFAAALTCLLVFLMDLTARHWWLLGIAVVLLAALTARELWAGEPFIDVRLFASDLPLTATYLRYALVMLITYCFVYGWTLWLEQAAGRSATDAGLLMMPSFAVAAVVSAFTARLRRLWLPAVAGAVAIAGVCVLLLTLRANSPLWLLVALSLLFGAQNGLNLVTYQSAMYTQAPPEATGAAAGLMRTFMYLGAIVSASLISISYGSRATDAGLHHLALWLTAVAVVLVAATAADRSLAGSRVGGQAGRRPGRRSPG